MNDFSVVPNSHANAAHFRYLLPRRLVSLTLRDIDKVLKKLKNVGKLTKPKNSLPKKLRVLAI